MTTMDSDRPDSASPSLAGPAHYDPNRLRWVPWAFVGFFGVVLLANSAMLWVAFSTWTGLAADRAYDRGIHYNEELEARAVQDALGWQADYAFDDMGERRVRVALTLRTPHDTVVDDAVVTAKFVRPTHQGFDTTVEMRKDGEGGYAAVADLPLSGQWEVRLTAEAPSGSWRLTDRVSIR